MMSTDDEVDTLAGWAPIISRNDLIAISLSDLK